MVTKKMLLPRIKRNVGPRTEKYQTFFTTLSKEITSAERQKIKDKKYLVSLKKTLTEKQKINIVRKLEYDVIKAQKRLKDLENSLMLTLEDHLEYDFLNYFVGVGKAILNKTKSSQKYIDLKEFKVNSIIESENMKKGVLRLNTIKDVLKKYNLTNVFNKR